MSSVKWKSLMPDLTEIKIKALPVYPIYLVYRCYKAPHKLNLLDSFKRRAIQLVHDPVLSHILPFLSHISRHLTLRRQKQGV